RYFKVTQPAAGATPAFEDEGLVWNSNVKITDHWSAVLQQARNITQRQDIRLGIGLAYRDECSYFELVYERQGGRDRTLGPSDSIAFRFALVGLGQRTTREF